MAGRRDNPAARAALARRRQRAARSIAGTTITTDAESSMPPPVREVISATTTGRSASATNPRIRDNGDGNDNENGNGNVRVASLATETAATAAAAARPPIPISSSPPRATQQRPRSSPRMRQLSQPQPTSNISNSNISNSNSKLTVDTSRSSSNKPVATIRPRQGASVTNSTTGLHPSQQQKQQQQQQQHSQQQHSQQQQQHRMAPSTRLAALQKKQHSRANASVSILGDGTLTTAALTTTTSSSSIYPVSPDKSSSLAHYTLATTIATTAPAIPPAVPETSAATATATATATANQSSTTTAPSYPRTTPATSATSATMLKPRTATTTTTTTPRQALSNSQQAADQASSILNAVTARNRYRLASPKNGATGTAGTAGDYSPTAAAVPSPSPSRVAQQEELLATSQRRRETMQSRHRFQPTTAVATPPPPPGGGGGGATKAGINAGINVGHTLARTLSAVVPHTTTTLRGGAANSSTVAISNSPPVAVRASLPTPATYPSVPSTAPRPTTRHPATTMTGSRFHLRRSARRSPSPVRRTTAPPSAPTPPSRPVPTPLNISLAGVEQSHRQIMQAQVQAQAQVQVQDDPYNTRADSPLTARMEKLEVTEKRRTDDPLSATRRQLDRQQPQQQQPQLQQPLPRQQQRPAQSHPKLPPPSPRRAPPSESRYTDEPTSTHQQRRKSRSPSPRPSPSPYPPTNNMSTTRSSPTQTPLQSRAMQQKTNRSQSPHRPEEQDYHSLPLQDLQQEQYPYDYSNQSGRTSPGVERLSAFLMDTSVTDTSTMADMTLPPMDYESTTPRNINSSYSLGVQEQEQHNPASFTSTLGAQPMFTPAKQSRQTYDDDKDDGGDYSMMEMSETPYGTPSAEDDGRANSYHAPPPKSPPDEDQATLDPGKFQNLDTACLQSGCTIMVRSYHRPVTITVDDSAALDEDPSKHTPKPKKKKYTLAQLSGVGLGREKERFTIQKVITTASHQQDDVVTSELRHGDNVLLYSNVAQGRALGSRKFVNSKGTASKLELGFFSGDGAKSELWTILSASRPDRQVLVGRAAVANNAKQQREAEKGSHSNSRNSGGMPAPVRSGDPILLRNCYNGGILSRNDGGKLVLLTDSYEHFHDSAEDPTHLGRLQHHDRLYPTPQDTFQLILSQIPPCPRWAAGRSTEERIFLTGSYVWQPRRNQRSAEFETALFGENGSSINQVLEAAERHVPSDENLSPKTKERILIDEVIGSFLGLEGLHIRLKGNKGHTSSMDHFEFQLFDADGVTFDVSLRNLVEQILPLSTSYVRVRNFISARRPGYEYGRVMQAFCEALDALLQDYVNFVAQMEWELRKYSKVDTLTMRSIYFQITPSLHSMSILEHATKAVCDTKGGALINALWSLDKQSYMGDSVAKKVLGILLDKASVPYMEMMSDWLQSGKLQDPYEEFMIRRSKEGSRAHYDGDTWLALFQVRDEHVVQGIGCNDSTKEKIVTTGKYWNAVQECHLDAKELPMPPKENSPPIPKLPFNSDSSAIAGYIDTMYQSASKVLMRIMMDKFKLMESLQIMKRYFLIDQGDFLNHFLDAAETELLKIEGDVSMGRVQHWLSTSVQLTEAHREEYDPVSGLRITTNTCPLVPCALRCRFSEDSLVGYLDTLYGGGIVDQGPITPSRRAYGMSTKGNSGIEVFSIDFQRIPFPISLVLSQKAMVNYKLLFRHLFFTKHVERRLIGVWRDNQLLKKLDSLRGLLGPTFLLRHRMLHFVQNLIYYMIFEVVESQWMEMRSAIDKAGNGTMGKSQTVDDILRVHNEFLERTLQACLLTNRHLVRSLTKLMNTCLLFTDQMKRFMDTTKIYDDSIIRAAEKRGVVQQKLNDRGLSQAAIDKRKLRKALDSTREERETVNNRQARRVGREVSSESYQRMIQRFDEVFSQDLADFMKQLNSHTTSGIVANLGIRLDYNGFVTASISKAAVGNR